MIYLIAIVIVIVIVNKSDYPWTRQVSMALIKTLSGQMAPLNIRPPDRYQRTYFSYEDTIKKITPVGTR